MKVVYPLRIKLIILIVVCPLFKISAQAIDLRRELNDYAQVLSRSLRYPNAAAKKNFESTIFVEFNLYASGRIEDIQVLNPFSDYFKEDIIKSIKSTNGAWFKDVANDTILKKVLISMDFRLASRNKMMPDSYYRVGIEFYKKANLPKAREMFLRAYLFNPLDSLNRNALISCLKEIGSDDDLIKQIENFKIEDRQIDFGINITGFGTKQNMVLGKDLGGMLGQLNTPMTIFYDSLWVQVKSNKPFYLRKFESYALYKYHGLVVDFFTENYQKFSEINYVKGNLHGTYRDYYTNGNKRTTGSFTNNQLTGNWTFYNDDQTINFAVKFVGNEIRFINYQNQIKPSINFEYVVISPSNNDNVFLIKGEVKSGFMDGAWKVFLNGNMIQEDVFERGKYLHSIFNNEKSYNRLITKDIFLPYHIAKLELVNH